MVSFFNLPADILDLIVDKVNASDIAAIAKTSKHGYGLTQTPKVIQRRLDELSKLPKYKRTILSILALLDKHQCRSDRLDRLLVIYFDHAQVIWRALSFDARQSKKLLMSYSSSLLLIFKLAPYAYEITQTIHYLDKHNVMTLKAEELIALKARYLKSTMKLCNSLEKMNELTKENVSLLFQQARYAQHIIECLAEWLRITQSPMAKEDLLILLHSGSNISSVFRALVAFQKAALLTDEHRQLITQYKAYAVDLAKSMVILHRANLLTPDNQNFLIQHLKFLPGFVKGMEGRMRLKIRFETILNQDYLSFIFRQTDRLTYIVLGMRILTDVGILGLKNCELLAENSEQLAGFTKYLCDIDNRSYLVPDRKPKKFSFFCDF